MANRMPIHQSAAAGAHQVDPASANFVFPNNVVAQPGHVYLLDQKAFKHWVLFEIELDPQPSE